MGGGGVFWKTTRNALARQQRIDLEWDDFRLEIERKIERAKALVDQTADFDPALALQEARVHGKNGFNFRVLDHLESASLFAHDDDRDTSGSEPRKENLKERYRRLGGEGRPTITLGPGNTLRIPLELPGEALELTFGMGSEKPGQAGPVQVRFQFGQREETIACSFTKGRPRWATKRIQLPDWAHGRGWLEWEVSNEGTEPIYLSEPVIFGKPERRLNIVMILEDTLRADHLSSYGYHRRTSPVKEALFKKGAVFEHAYSQGPTTLISCPSLMTSLYPSATGVVAHEDRLPFAALTLAEILRDQGFATGALLQNPYAGRLTGLHQGYERVGEKLEKHKWPTSKAVYESLAADWLDAFSGRNTFLYIHIFDPHHPYQNEVRFRYAGAERAGTAEEERKDPLAFKGDPDQLDPDSAEGKRLQYGGEIRRNDFHFGHFIDQLEERGILKDTLIVFVSDHGEYFGERGMWVHTPPGFVQVTHVPLMMRHPDLIPEGLRIEEPVQLVDVVPTLLDLLEIPKEPFLLSGDSLVPLIRGEKDTAESWNRRVILSEENDYFGASFLRGPWHVLGSSAFMWNIDKHKREPFPLRAWRRIWNSGEQMRVFNLETDPLERDPWMSLSRNRDFQQEYLSLRESLLGEYTAVHALLNRGEADAVEIDPDVLEKLKDLGYI